MIGIHHHLEQTRDDARRWLSRSNRPRVARSTLAEWEKYLILRALVACQGSTPKAADLLGVSPRKIHYRLAAWRREERNGP